MSGRVRVVLNTADRFWNYSIPVLLENCDQRSKPTSIDAPLRLNNDSEIRIFLIGLIIIMSTAEANLELPANFAGIVKVFPLPNLVMFPGVIQPLHIFEPRYRKLIQDAIDSDLLIAVATLKPGWESRGRTARPEIFPTLCIGKIVTHARLPDGRFNLLLCGARRAKVIREIPAELPYRMADVNLVRADPFSGQEDELAIQLREKVLEQFQVVAATDSRLDFEAFSGLSNSHLPLGLLLDLVTFSCGASVIQQQEILETDDLFARGNQLLRILRKRISDLESNVNSFPPMFSAN